MEQKKKNATPLGRPRTRLEPLEAIPTRCPKSMKMYFKSIYAFQYPSLTEMYEKMLRQFIDTQPWDSGLEWRKPNTAIVKSGNTTGKTGWTTEILHVPGELKTQVENLARLHGVSNAAFAYTAMFWWAQYVMPADKVAGKRPSPKK